MKKLQLSIAIAAIISANAFAAGGSVDARSDAMGGVGVAVSHYSVAAPVNPALVAKYGESDDFAVVLPALGVEVSDKDKLIDDLDDIKDHYNAFQDAVNSAADATGAARTLSNDIKGADGKTVNANVGANVQIAIPNELASVSFFGNAYATGMVGTDVSDADLTYLNGVADGSVTADPDFAFSSKAVGVVAVIQDYGVAIAHKFDVAGMPLYVGVSPKVQKIDTFNYSSGIYDYDRSDLTDDKYRTSENHFNADIGAALDDGNFTYGVAVRNLISKDVTTKEVAGTSYTYQVAPVATLGAAYHNDWFTVSADIDANKTKGFKGVEESQYAGIGAELDLAKWVQLRAGFRTDMTGDNPNLFTAGLGISPWDIFHMDLAGQVGSDKALGAMLTTKLTF